MAKLADWDCDGYGRNLNFSSASRFNRVPPASSNINSLLSKNDDFPSATENSGFVPVIQNGNQLTYKNTGPQFESKKLTIPSVSKRKNSDKLKKEVSGKKPKFHKSERPITPMEKFISSATDLNILKSERTYAKKPESISPVAYDTLNCDGVESTSSLSSEETNADGFYTVKRNSSSTLKHNDLVVSECNIDNVANELPTDDKLCLFSDILYSECNSNLLDYSNKLESADSTIKEQATDEYNNGYQRTRKNLKTHLGGKRKTNFNTESSPTVKKSKVVKTVSKATTKKYLNTRPTLKKERSKKSEVNAKAPTICNETGLPIVLQKSNTPQKIEVDNCKAIAHVSPTIRNQEASKSSSDASTHNKTYSNKRGRRKINTSNLESSYSPSSNEPKKNNILSDRRGAPVQSSNKHSRRKIISSPRRRVSILDIAKELSFNQFNQLKEPHLQSKKSTPKSPTNDFEINVYDCPAPKTTSKKHNFLSDKVNKLEKSSSSQSNPSEISHLLSKDISPTLAVSGFESNIVKGPAPKPVSSKKCNVHSGQVNKIRKKSSCLQNNHSFNESNNSNLLLNSMERNSNNSTPDEKHIHLLAALSFENLDVSSYLSDDDEENIDKLLPKSTNATNFTSLDQRQPPDASLIRHTKKNKSISLDGDLHTAKHPSLSNCVPSESDLCTTNIEATKKHLFNQPGKNFAVNRNAKKIYQNSELPSDAPVLNFVQKNTSASPHKLSSPHVCSKTKLVHLPLLVCDCNNQTSSSNSNTDLLSLSVQINNFTSKIVSLAKKNPKKLQSLVSESALNTFCKKIEKYFLQSNTENSASPDSHLYKTNSPTFKNDLSNSLLGASCNMELETDLQTQNRALDCNLESKHAQSNHSGALDFNFKESDAKHTKASDFSCDLESETDIQNQKKTFIQNAFYQINFIHNHCITKLSFDYIGNCDAFELQASVTHFCDDPQTVELMSKFLSEIEKFDVLSSTVKVPYEFPVNFQDLPLCMVIQSYIKYFVFKIYPLNCEAITSQSVLNFANENMSASEITVVSCFFNEVGLLKPQDFLSRFTCVAIVAIYKEYHRRKSVSL